MSAFLLVSCLPLGCEPSENGVAVPASSQLETEAAKASSGGGAASPPTAAPSAPTASVQVAATEASETIEQLKRRITALAAALAAAPSKPSGTPPRGTPAPPKSDPGAALPTIDELMRTLDERDGAKMSGQMEKLLFAGEKGYKRAHEFFHQCDVEHQKILILTHDLQLTYGLLRLVQFYPDEVVTFAKYLMKATEHQPESFIRREIFNFLPPFLRYHKGRYPALKTAVENQIVHQLRAGGQYMYKSLLAMEKLDFAPPIADLELILGDPKHVASHPAIIANLAQRGNEGEQSLMRYVEAAREYKTVTVRSSLRALAALESPSARQLIQRYLRHPDPNAREAALVAHFVYPRDLESLQYAVDYLNSNVTVRRKRSFIARLRQKNRVILDALKANPAALFSEEVRGMVATEGKRQRSRG